MTRPHVTEILRPRDGSFTTTQVRLILSRDQETPGTGDRRHEQPRYAAKAAPACQDMPVKLRRVLITARISAGSAGQPTPN